MAEAGQLQPSSQAWCAGLARVGTRALDDYELRSVRRRIGTVRRAGWAAATAAGAAVATNTALAIHYVDGPMAIVGAAAAATLTTFGLFGVLLALLGPSSRLRLLAATGCVYLLLVLAGDHLATAHLGRSAGPMVWHLTRNVAVGALLVGLVAFFRGARELWRTRRQVRLALADLDGADCERYEGEMPHRVHPLLDQLASDCSLGPGDRHRLEVLPLSRVVVRANGHPVHRWRTAPRSDLAPGRPHALRVPIQTTAASTDVQLRRRALSQEERVEIRRHAARLTRRIQPLVAGAGAALAFPLVEHWVYGAQAMVIGPGAFVWYGFALVTALGYGFRIRAAASLRRDADLQWLVSVHEPGSDPLQSLPRMEVLPFSQLLWTEGERPALWRASRH